MAKLKVSLTRILDGHADAGEFSGTEYYYMEEAAP